MTDRVDRKLQDVAVAQYLYRHEAEFAAGFLDDADIPYRLQIDDPSLGISIGSPAIVWVRGVDVQRAREVLEISGEKMTLTRPAQTERSGRPAQPAFEALTVRERVLAAVGSLGVVGVASILPDGGSSPRLSIVVAITAGILLLAAIVGRAPRPLKSLLGALSGGAP
jgi:hypothetical protein